MKDGFWTALKLFYLVAAQIALMSKLQHDGMDFIDWYAAVGYSIMFFIIVSDVIFIWRKNKVDILPRTD